MTEAIMNNENIEQADQVIKPLYTFRTLCAQDVFPMTNIIKKIGIKEFKTFFEGDKLNEIMSAFSGNLNDKTIESVGFSVALELADIIFGNLSKCENDIFQLLSQTSDLSVEEVRNLALPDFAEMVIDFVKKDEFKDFIKVVSRSFK